MHSPSLGTGTTSTRSNRVATLLLDSSLPQRGENGTAASRCETIPTLGLQVGSGTRDEAGARCGGSVLQRRAGGELASLRSECSECSARSAATGTKEEPRARQVDGGVHGASLVSSEARQAELRKRSVASSDGTSRPRDGQNGTH